ncbi:SRPBCC family protein [Aldersonia sp. NBC_00410]|uniref:SRPBCC family protein n=1 Tax=Aldersonia sp. NBC_00410 TaxID=2975954 RepID=UPI0022509F8E|nr:SRPBCC family protein [Aldersonia sp. NBC_00410]MCX5043079.1 SRPBCC family protein [Aldersonia sp. NBC_00410]
MGQVSASSTATIDAAPERVLTALSDYQDVRPRILSAHYRDYRVVSGGKGDGTVAHWTLQATEKRSRNVEATVTVANNTVTERDLNSSMVTTYSVAPSGSGSTVTTKTEWTGAGGIGGIFEGIFAPLGLKKIQAEVLANLKKELS